MTESETSHKGEIALLKVISRALEKRVVVSKPLTEAARYDLIIDLDGRLLRVQVKYANGSSSKTDGSIRLYLRTSHRRGIRRLYTENEVDAIAAYLPKTDKVYLFPVALWGGKSEMALRLEPAKNNQMAGCLSAKDFEW